MSARRTTRPSHRGALALATALLAGCAHPLPAPLLPALDGAPAARPLQRLHILQGEAALEPAYLRVSLVDRTRAPRARYRALALPATWDSARILLHSTDPTPTLLADREAIVNRATDFTGTTTSAAVFTNLRPGNYLFQVTLYTAAGANGTSAAVHTVNLALSGGTATALTVTMKPTDGTGAAGGTQLNSTISDTLASLVRATDVSVLGGPAGTPVIMAGDTLTVSPDLADSSAAGAGTVTAGGSSVVNQPDLSPGVLSRVLLSYVKATVTPTGALLDPAETLLADWVRGGNEPLRGVTWAALADASDGGTWPARGAGFRAGVGTFGATFAWATHPTTSFTDPAPFPDESALAANYQLVFRFYDNSARHNLIALKTRPLCVVQPASIGLTLD